GVADREVRQDLPVNLDVCLLQALDEPAVGPALTPDGRVDADDPQAAELALALLAVARRVGERVEEGLLRRLDQPRARALPALGVLEESLVAGVRGDAALDSRHVDGLLEVRQQALDLLRVDAVHRRDTGVPAGSTGRLDLEMVAAPGVHPDHLATARHADAL